MRQDQLPFVAGSSTSQAAAMSMKETAATLRERVRQFIASRGKHGATRDEVESELSLKHQTAGPRCWELIKGGLVVEVDGTRPARSGRDSRILVLPEFQDSYCVERFTEQEDLEAAHDLQKLGAEIDAEEVQKLRARVDELENLAYLGEHRFPDMSYKALYQAMATDLQKVKNEMDAAWKAAGSPPVRGWVTLAEVIESIVEERDEARKELKDVDEDLTVLDQAREQIITVFENRGRRRYRREMEDAGGGRRQAARPLAEPLPKMVGLETTIKMMGKELTDADPQPPGQCQKHIDMMDRCSGQATRPCGFCDQCCGHARGICNENQNASKVVNGVEVKYHTCFNQGDSCACGRDRL